MREPEPEYESGDGRMQQLARDLQHDMHTGCRMDQLCVRRTDENRAVARTSRLRERSRRQSACSPFLPVDDRRTDPDLHLPRSTRSGVRGTLRGASAALSSPVACPFCSREAALRCRNEAIPVLSSVSLTSGASVEARWMRAVSLGSRACESAAGAIRLWKRAAIET